MSELRENGHYFVGKNLYSMHTIIMMTSHMVNGNIINAHHNIYLYLYLKNITYAVPHYCCSHVHQQSVPVTGGGDGKRVLHPPRTHFLVHQTAH